MVGEPKLIFHLTADFRIAHPPLDIDAQGWVGKTGSSYIGKRAVDGNGNQEHTAVA